MNRGTKGALAAFAVGLMTAAVSAVPAQASVTVGADFDGYSGGTGCFGARTVVQTGSPLNSYAAPFDGVLTSWASNTDYWTTAKLKVVRVGSGGSFTVLAEDGPRTSNGTVNAIRVPVRLGDVLGLSFVGSCGSRPNAGFTTSLVAADAAPGPGLFSSSDTGSQIPVTAQIEHDADGDGYGDETQDGCPTDASRIGPCAVPDTTPPETFIDKGPKKKTTSKSATFEFSSSEPGSTFECSVDSSGFKPCTSPDKVKVKGTGKHNFLVRAKDAAGNLDTSEASYSWKLAKKKHKKH